MMKLKAGLLLSLLLSFFLLPTGGSYAIDFTTVKVTESAIKALPRCLDYELKAALCVWIKFRLTGPPIITITPKVRHKLPDFVVTSFIEGGDTPYTEIRNTESIIAKQVQQSSLVKAALGTNRISNGSFSNAQASGQMQTQNTRFNETNVVGNPAIKIIQEEIKKLLGGASFLCDSNVEPLKPYFMSELDTVAWRMPSIETLKYPLNAIPGNREVSQANSFLGRATQTWGSVFPRVGYVLQQQPSKAAAVAGQRAIDIVFHDNQMPHVYSVYEVTGRATFIVNKDKPERNVSWQMITPKEQNSCEAFGSSGNWGEGKTAVDGDYGWNYWTEYQCCIPGPGKLLFHYDF